MEENEKPFACVTDGCQMRFTNEDHLTVHKKKHDMILNLGNGQKSNTFVADQTPTPTRFIRNCEEVGLFQDLQINPFDETFRKAVEAGKSGNHLQYADSLAVPATADDTLHTPHVVIPFPHASEDHHRYKPAAAAAQHGSKKEDSLSSNDSLLLGGSSDSSSSSNAVAAAAIESCYPKVKQPARHKAKRTVSKATTPVVTSTSPASTSRLPLIKPAITDTAVLSSNKKETVSVAGQSMQLLLRMPDGKLVQLVQENVVKPQLPTINITTVPTPENNGLAIAKMKLKQALTNNGRISVSTAALPDLSEAPPPVDRPSPTSLCYPHRESGSGEDDDGRKNKFRERNRAAAKRCREKRQSWVQDLEKRAEAMHTTNLQLQGEVTSLRAEVAQLKTLLLAHKNCPVTQAMHNSSQAINFSCVPISTIQSCLLPTSQPSRIVSHPTASTSSKQQQQPSATNSIVIETTPAGNSHKRKRHKSNNEKSIGNTSATNDIIVQNGSNLATLSGRAVASSNGAKVDTVPNSQTSFINFSHLLSLSACATNENNVNMERFKSVTTVMERLEEEEEEEDDDDASVPVTRHLVVAMEGGRESKVIKLNPRYRSAPVLECSSSGS